MVSLHQAKVSIFISVVISLSSAGDVVSKQIVGDKQMGDNTVCKFEIIDIEKVKHQFTQLSTLGNVQMIRFNVDINQNNSASAHSEYFQSLNELHSNGLERWIWMLQQHSHLLTYSPDFEVVTLNRSTSIQRNIYVPVVAFTNNNDTGVSHYKNCTESLFYIIYKEIINNTNSNSDWLLCHRYFEGQEWKLGFLYKATGAWIGYDFECFSSNCQNTHCAQHIKKGRVNVIINISIFVVACYFPLLFLLLPKRTVKTSENPVYSMGDQPFSLTSYIFRLNSRKKCKVSSYLNSFSDKCNKFLGNTRNIFDDCLPEISLISFLYLIVMLVFFIQRFYFPKLIPDFNKYVDVYHPCITYNLLSDCDSEKHDLDLILSTLTTILAPMYFLVLSLVYIHSDDTSTLLKQIFRKDSATANVQSGRQSSHSINFVDDRHQTPALLSLQRHFFPDDEPEMSTIECTGYTKFAMNFLDRISLFFKSELWQQLFIPPYVFETKIFTYLQLLISVPLNVLSYLTVLLVPIVPFLVNIVLVFPIRFIWNFPNSERTGGIKLLLGFFILLYIVCQSMFILFFFSPYFVYILQSILRTMIYTFFVAGPLFTSISYDFLALVLAISLYVIKYVVSFYHIYRNLLDTLLKMQIEEDAVAKDKKPTIPVDLFKHIVNKYIPLRTQLVMLSLKILVTSLFLYVAINTLSQVGQQDLFSSPVPALVATIMPILAEKLCSSDQAMEIKLQKDFIKEDLKRARGNVDDKQYSSVLSITPWIIIFPAFYTVLSPVEYLLDTLFPKYKETYLDRIICCAEGCCKGDGQENTQLINGGST